MGTFIILFMLIFGLLIGLVAGFIMHRSDFCIAGMFRDFFLFRSLLKLRALLLLIVSSMVLFELARYLGFLSLYPFPLIGSPSLTNVIGGFFSVSAWFWPVAVLSARSTRWAPAAF